MNIEIIKAIYEKATGWKAIDLNTADGKKWLRDNRGLLLHLANLDEWKKYKGTPNEL